MLIREAEKGDLARIVELLLDDEIARAREDGSVPVAQCYEEAFAEISADANNVLLVVEIGGRVEGFLQVSFARFISHRGSLRATIENVRVSGEKRNCGIGTELLKHALSLARKRGCKIAQLTSDKRRSDAHRFYGRLGFKSTSEGMKLLL